MGNTFQFIWEVNLIEWLQSIFSSDAAIQIWSVISMFGEEMVCVAILGFFYWGLDKETGKYIGTNVVVNIVFTPFIKNIFNRRRPYFDNTGINILKPVDADADIYDIAAQGYSFPSGHSSSSATVFGSLYIKAKKSLFRILILLIPFLVGVSRFVLGAHYPTDVLVGWLLGAGIVIFVPLLRKKISNDCLFYGILALAGLPGFFFCTSYDFYSGYGLMIGVFMGFMFENKFVKFSNTKNLLLCIVRTVIGGALFLGLNALLKLPFSKDFLEDASKLSQIVKAVRYMVISFAVVGLYPMAFKLFKKQ